MENQNLKVVTFNCRSVIKSWPDVQLSCRKNDVVHLQETWLTKQNLSILASISSEHFAFAYSPVSNDSGIRLGRSKGGTAIL